MRFPKTQAGNLTCSQLLFPLLSLGKYFFGPLIVWGSLVEELKRRRAGNVGEKEEIITTTALAKIHVMVAKIRGGAFSRRRALVGLI